MEEAEAADRHAELARALCSRHYGVGADGVEFLERRADGSFSLRLFNADGSEAELSGNGTRCVAAWLADSEGLHHVVLGTHGGPRTCDLVSHNGGEYLLRTGMGVPQTRKLTVDVSGTGPVAGIVVDLGNPHFVVFTDDPDFRVHGHAWEALGALLCTHADFPKQTNVEFVRVVGPDAIEFRIYERGVGPTYSSGTGTCASAAAAIQFRACHRELAVSSLGGRQQVRWPTTQAEMLLTGTASIICTGLASTTHPVPAQA